MYKGHEMENKFLKALLAARRAKQLINGDKKKLDIKAENPLTVAMEEIKKEKVDFNYITRIPLILEEPENEETNENLETDAISSLLTARKISSDPDDEAEEASSDEEKESENEEGESSDFDIESDDDDFDEEDQQEEDFEEESD